MSDGGDRRKVWYLRRLDLFAAMTDEEVEAIARLLDDHHLPAGVGLLGDRRRERAYLIKEGAVRLHAGGPTRPVTLALLGPGRVFGLSAVIGDEDPTVGAMTVAPSYVCFATWPKLLEVLALHPQAMLRMTQGLAEQVFRAETWRGRLGMAAPRARLADLLLELGDEFGEATETGWRVPFRLTQADLARMIGASRETASRLMGEFARAGWVTRERGLLTVRDRAGLAAQAGENRAAKRRDGVGGLAAVGGEPAPPQQGGPVPEHLGVGSRVGERRP